MGNKVPNQENINNDINYDTQYKEKQREYFLNLAVNQITENETKTVSQIKPFSEIVEVKPKVEQNIEINNKPAIQQNPNTNKEIDIEHVTIEKIFRITLDKTKSDKASYIESYANCLLDSGKDLKFRVSDLDNLLITLIELEKKSILNFFMTSYHRGYELIENKYKQLLASKFGDTLKLIASYFSMIITSPENFELVLNYDDIFQSFSKYIDETTCEDEVFSLLDNLYLANEDFKENIISCFYYIINKFNQNNVKNFVDSKGSFFKTDLIKKNLQFISTWLSKGTPYFKKNVCITSHKSFLPSIHNQTSSGIGKSTILGLYFSLNIMETEFDDVKKYLSAITVNEAKAQINSVSERINLYTTQLGNLCKYLIDQKEFTSYMLLLIKINKDKLKTHSMAQMNSDGFLMNVVTSLINVFLSDFNCSSMERVITIDPKIFLSNELNDLERIEHDFAKVLTSEQEFTNKSVHEYNSYSKSFLFGHILLELALESFSKQNRQLLQQAQLLSGNPNNPEFRKLVTNLNMIYSIFKCPKFTAKLFSFLEVSIYLCFTRNNSKYSIESYLEKGESEFKTFHDDFIYYIQDESNLDISSMPVSIFKNISKVVKFLREVNPDVFSKYMETSKLLVYFSLIYSSKTKIIKNPYLRADALDIVEYLFINQEGNKKTNSLIKIFNDSLIRENFLYSLVRVFIDSERLGGSNQFYEKFGVRHKILLLIDSIKNQISIDDQLLFYAVKYKDDCILFVNFLINDLTFLADETIEKLKEIKNYQSIKADKLTFDSLNEEDKQRLEEKYNDNSQRCKNFIPLFNSSLQFMITISNTCQNLILEYKLGQRLANLINYLLQMFASKSSSALKIDNFSEFKFNPKEILNYIITIYAAFVNHKDFLNYIVSDERSFDIQNFLRANSLRTKIKVPFNVGEAFVIIVKELTSMKDSLGSKYVDFDDAPDEFLDPITAATFRIIKSM